MFHIALKDQFRIVEPIFIFAIGMLIAVDKPLELSSFDIVKRMKHVFPREKIGHSGTLDPKATGLMVLGIGKGTKKLTSLIGLDKKYETIIDFSKISDTWDMGYRETFKDYPLYETPHSSKAQEGARGILKNSTLVPAPTLQQLQNKLQSLIPARELPLPAFSAKKKEGKRLYQLARSGKEISASRVMKVHSFTILKYSFPELCVKLEVGSGTYIRSIGYWLGQEFELGGILTALKRISLGEWSLERLRLDQEVAYHMRGQAGVMKWGIIEEE